MTGTANYHFPFLVTAQSAKEITHNEALIMIDALVASVVVDGPLNIVPEEALEGQCWVIGDEPEGDWEGQAGKVALWSAGGWRMINPTEKMCMRRLSDGTILTFESNSWRLPEAIGEATGGTTVDAEARLMLSELVVLLQGHGLLRTAQ